MERSRQDVARDREKGTITINQRDYTENVIERFRVKGCNPTYTPDVGPELSLNQPEGKLLDEEGKKRDQSITGAVMYLEQISRSGAFFSVNQLARETSKSSKAHMGAAKSLLRYLAGSGIFSISYTSQEGSSMQPTLTQNGATIPIMANQRLRVSLCSPMAPLTSRWASKV